MRKLHVALTVFAVALLGGAGVASAQTAPDVEAEVTTYLTSAFGQLVPVVLAVVTASLGILVLTIGVRMAVRAVKSRGQAAA